MSTYSVYNIKIDNSLSFTPGPTAGYVLAINGDGSTYWSQGGSGGSGGGSGTSGSSGSSGTSGINGQNGQSSSYFLYKAKTTSTSGDPGSSYIIWNNSTQASATQINISHLTQDNIDIDIFLSLVRVGTDIIIQDQGNSGNYQLWNVNGTPISNTGYWSIPVNLTNSTYSFSNNNNIIVAIAADSGTSGSSGSSGTSGINGSNGTSGSSGLTGSSGSSGTSGINGTSGTSPAGGGAPIRLTNQSIGTSGWFATGSYYGYTFSNINITTNTNVDFTPYNDSAFYVFTAKFQPYIYSGSGYAIFYASYPTYGTVSGDMLITTTT